MHHCTHKECLSGAMARAEVLCAGRGARLTEIRKRVLEIIWGGHKAVTAAEIMKALGDDKPPTTYRALEFLEGQGLVHRVTALNAYTGCPHPEAAHVGQLLVCEVCRDVEEVALPQVGELVDSEAKRRGFAVRAHFVEVLGTCAECAAGVEG